MRTLRAALLCLALAACDRAGQSDTAGQAGAGPPDASATVVAAGPADPAYVAGLMRDTAFDSGSCSQSARLQGVASPVGVAAPTVIIAVDSSGSMAARSPSGGTRMTEAARAVSSFAAHLLPGTRVGVAAFGQAGTNRDADKARSCRAPVAMLLTPIAGGAGVSEAAARLRPAGWTPLAAAITAASTQAGPRGVVYVVSDGIETCGGDPVAAARAAHTAEVVVNVVGFGIADRGEEDALRAIAAASGGRYLAAAAGELDAALRTEASRAISGNSVATGQAMQDQLGCYYDHMREQAETTGRRINADQQANRISSATAAAAFKAQDTRYANASAELTKEHIGLAAEREATNAKIVDALNARP